MASPVSHLRQPIFEIPPLRLRFCVPCTLPSFRPSGTYSPISRYTSLLTCFCISRSPSSFLSAAKSLGWKRETEKPGRMPQIQYSEKYFDDTYEYRHVVLPADIAKLLPKNRLLSEAEWRGIGVQQSRGWVHYAIHRPEPHIMLFRRPLNYGQPQQAAAVQQQQAAGMKA